MFFLSKFQFPTWGGGGEKFVFIKSPTGTDSPEERGTTLQKKGTFILALASSLTIRILHLRKQTTHLRKSKGT